MTGETIQVERTGRSKTAATTNLQRDVYKLAHTSDGSGGDGLKATDKVERAAQLWLDKFEGMVADGVRSATTLDLYRGQLEAVVLPSIGQLRLAECTVGRMDMFFTALSRRRTASGMPLSAKYRQSIRTIIKSILAQAVTHGAIPQNPIRDISPIEERRKKPPRALTHEERRRLFAWFTAEDGDGDTLKAREAARRHDLPDLLTLMLGTGVRIGEALAVRWNDLDLEGVPIVEPGGRMAAQPIMAVTGNIVRVKGKGLIRNPGKTEKSLRIAPLPQFVTDVLKRRMPEDCDPDLPVFPTIGAHGITWRDPRNVSGEILAMRRAMGIDWPLTSHTFRRTAATIWHDAGTLTDRQAADLMGHAQITMMLNRYVARGELHPAGAAVMDAAWMNS